MNEDFHYYATYCAASIAGFDPAESETIAYSANFVDLCSRPFLERIGAPVSAATTQLSMEMANARTDLVGIQDITRIWSSFHFIPRDLYADVKKGFRKYKEKYRLICGPNGQLIKDTVENAKDKTLQSIGIAMHVLADSWAHRNFAGTPSLVINNTNREFYELVMEGDELVSKQIKFRHSLGAPDDLENHVYSSSPYQPEERAIMNLGHGRAGHLPDYSFIRYRYLPAWGDYDEIVKDNQADYFYAFCQMTEALKYLHGDRASFETDVYDYEGVSPWEERIRAIIAKRQLLANEDWKELGVQITGTAAKDNSIGRFQDEYMNAPSEQKGETFLGKFITGALSQKSMVTNKIYQSGNRLAGISVEYKKKGKKGIRDYHLLINEKKGGQSK